MSVDHTDISRACFRSLALSQFDGTPIPVTDPDLKSSDFDEAWRDFESKYPFMEYVLRHWAKHVQKSSRGDIQDDLLLLFDEGSSSYKLWTFGRHYHGLHNPLFYDQAVYGNWMFTHGIYDHGVYDHGVYDHGMDIYLFQRGKYGDRPLECLRRVKRPLEPSALHWATMLALPNICTVLIGRGKELDASSVVGTPMYCAKTALDFISTHLRCEQDGRWLWECIEEIIKILIAGGNIYNAEDSRGRTHSVVELLYDSYSYQVVDKNYKLLESVFAMDPKISMDDLFSFIEYASRSYLSKIFDDARTFELLKWATRTNFKHFNPDTLPITLTIILCELAKPGKPSTNLKCLLQIDLHDITRENNGLDLDCALRDKSEDWMAKLHVAILQWILVSKEKVPHSLERMLVRIVSDEFVMNVPCIFEFIRDIVTTSLSNNIKLNLNLRCTDKEGDMLMHQIFKIYTRHSVFKLGKPFLAAIFKHGADLTLSNNSGMSPIELLIQNKKKWYSETLLI
ncbi:predicted protein [Sclerotinia sclerotiorum 1980 UF-70]|uniref:Uncharacterized protein n=2 Tax=Sclerotinia sclerotiorum (strain ATCC 18683 / 1980 / Ss-1) TaxID=665079 RepID=A7EVZ3_SCLS1|nr:predicted protein [Sclerotinia sclerotiorum 1980 UF-70]APA15681.1 hypothetical protein sscle_15g104510 [Sclerotinia sclerotiorum 1980 UF-70]EDN93635.1 predicted protein [Sclerotinia sclerotiorum 1980 UF-70]